MTLYLLMVLSGYGAFVATLGFHWLRSYVDDAKAAPRAGPRLEARQQGRPHEVRQAA